MSIVDWPLTVTWAVCGLLLLIGAKFRLSALLAAGAAYPGSKRTVRTLVVLAWDLVSFAAAAMVLRLAPFPLLMSGILVFGFTSVMLGIQWYFQVEKAPQRPSRVGVPDIQKAALNMGYTRVVDWIRGEFDKNAWRAGLAYQGILVVVCLGLRVLDTLQGGSLYLIFSLIWQCGATGAVYWCFDRQRPGSAPGSGGPGTAGGSAAAGPGIRIGRDPYSGLLTGAPGTQTPGKQPYQPPDPRVHPVESAGSGGRGQGPASAPQPKRKKVSLRADIQAFVALTAGIWCGIFSRSLGWWYGFSSVTLFRTLLSLATPIASGLLGKYIPTSLQPLLKTAARTSPWSVQYLKSKDFWYGPGMGMIGGVVGAVFRYLLFGR